MAGEARFVNAFALEQDRASANSVDPLPLANLKEGVIGPDSRGSRATQVTGSDGREYRSGTKRGPLRGQLPHRPEDPDARLLRRTLACGPDRHAWVRLPVLRCQMRSHLRAMPASRFVSGPRRRIRCARAGRGRAAESGTEAVNDSRWWSKPAMSNRSSPMELDELCCSPTASTSSWPLADSRSAHTGWVVVKLARPPARYLAGRLAGIARPPVRVGNPPAGIAVDSDVPVVVRDGTRLRVNAFRPARGGCGPGDHVSAPIRQGPSAPAGGWALACPPSTGCCASRDRSRSRLGPAGRRPIRASGCLAATLSSTATCAGAAARRVSAACSQTRRPRTTSTSSNGPGRSHGRPAR